ncbi:MAG: hypothetical protein NT027_05740 [Proteobacteria bacterium]|nr:hypothetical protein [Pseudomonadota bacterium]
MKLTDRHCNTLKLRNLLAGLAWMISHHALGGPQELYCRTVKANLQGYELTITKTENANFELYLKDCFFWHGRCLDPKTILGPISVARGYGTYESEISGQSFTEVRTFNMQNVEFDHHTDDGKDLHITFDKEFCHLN